MDKRWGVARTGMPRWRTRNGAMRGHMLYEVIPTGQVAFLPEDRRVCMNVTFEEAQALCTIMNAGANNDSTIQSLDVT